MMQLINPSLDSWFQHFIRPDYLSNTESFLCVVSSVSFFFFPYFLFDDSRIIVLTISKTCPHTAQLG